MVRRTGQLFSRTVRIIRDGSRMTLPIGLLLAGAVAILVLQVAPMTNVSAKLMVAAPRYAKDLETTIVSVEAVEVARVVYRDLTGTGALRQAAFAADLIPARYAPRSSGVVAEMRQAVMLTTATDKDKVTVISLDVHLGERSRALRVAEGLIVAAQGIDLAMREAILSQLASHLGADQTALTAELSALGPVVTLETAASVTEGLAGGLKAERQRLEAELTHLLRNDPVAAGLRSDIASINGKLRAISLVETARGLQGAVSHDLIEAQALVAKWESEEAAARALVAEDQRKRDGLMERLADVENQLALVRSAIGLERMESNRRVSVMAAPQVRSAKLPTPGVLAIGAALTLGLIAWFGGALAVEAANPRLRNADDLVRSFSISALSVIPELDQPLRQRIRRGPDRSPPRDVPLVFVAGARS